ncbi:hypothetical protein DMUE_3948 [Dictyocoela muelleri]|nr:hypothetical protein DMUE_3948 [Dictyocoela muelleri]
MDIFIDVRCDDTDFSEDINEIEDETITSTVKKRDKRLKKNNRVFLGLLAKSHGLKDISFILNLCAITVSNQYNIFLEGDLRDLTSFKSAVERRSIIKKNYSQEKNIITCELSYNPRVSLKFLSEKLLAYNLQGSYSIPTVSRIIKSMGYSRKTLILVLLNRNSN